MDDLTDNQPLTADAEMTSELTDHYLLVLMGIKLTGD